MARYNERFYTGAEDCKWLQHSHLVYYNDVAPYFKSFILTGNEDYPDTIKLYDSDDPEYTAKPILFLVESDGKYLRVEEST